MFVCLFVCTFLLAVVLTYLIDLVYSMLLQGCFLCAVGPVPMSTIWLSKMTCMLDSTRLCEILAAEELLDAL